MIFHDVEGGSPEWHQLRLGIPTASCFDKILTPAKLELSSQHVSYMRVLLGEWILGEQVENFKSEWMERGTDLEDKAVQAFEMLTETETTRGGFITTDDGMIGCSPDRLIGDAGDLELKCPLIQTQVGYALSGVAAAEDYKLQLQGRMMIHEREYVSIYAYHPRLLIDPVKVYRDEEIIKKMRPVLRVFVHTMLELRLRLEKEFGPFVRPEPPEARDFSKDFVSDEDVERILAAQREVSA